MSPLSLGDMESADRKRKTNEKHGPLLCSVELRRSCHVRPRRECRRVSHMRGMMAPKKECHRLFPTVWDHKRLKVNFSIFNLLLPRSLDRLR